MKDLIILTADNDIKFLLQGLLPRVPKIENTAGFTFDIHLHMYRDSGVFNHAHEFLRPFTKSYKHAIAIFDKDGCGQEHLSREAIEAVVENNLRINGWDDAALAIVVAPEIENWIWVKSTHMQNTISWDFDVDIYDWLHNTGQKAPNQLKPSKPKEAFEAVLRKSFTARSSFIYEDIAKNASYRSCIDPAFVKMIGQLKTWFAK